MGERTIDDLKQLQALPLHLKVSLTKSRIRQWVNEFGTDGVYVSFSGGKDSTVLLHLVRELYPEVPAVFCDTGLEYPEIRDFVKTFDNVVWLKPKMTFRKVIEKYGYPFISKEVSECVQGAKKYLTSLMDEGILDRPTDRPTDPGKYQYFYHKLKGIGKYQTKSQPKAEQTASPKRNYSWEWTRLRGLGKYSRATEKEPKRWEQSAVSTDARDVHERQDDSGYP